MFVCLFVCLFVCKLFFSVKHFSETTRLRILKVGINIGYDKYKRCKKESATYCFKVPLFVHFSFSPTKNSVTDFSASSGAWVFKLCIHIEDGQVYCVNESQGTNVYFSFFFKFSFFSFLTPI